MRIFSPFWPVRAHKPIYRLPRWLRHTLRLGLRSVVVACLSLIVLGGYLWVSTKLPSAAHVQARAALGSTRILDRNGELLYEVPDPLRGQQQPVALDDIPVTLRQATIAVEDGSFYTNPGVDLRGIVRAAWSNLRSGRVVAGGSTITQQLARNFLLDPQLAQQRTLERKVREMILALKLTAVYSKDEILTLYLNQTYYGGTAYGVEAAAQHFFGKPVRDLSLAESALLAGLPQAPSAYTPLDNQEVAQQRQQQVLHAMVRDHYIQPAQAQAAAAERLQFAGEQSPMRAPHFVYHVLDILTARLGADTVVRGGLTVTTTLDVTLQTAAQTTLRRHIDQLAQAEVNHQVHNGAVVVLEPASGDILALVGSPDFDNVAIQGQVNAALALRQPGSAIKPLTYAAALERGWTPATVMLDIPSTFTTREGRSYLPGNYDQTYQGPILLREALATSSNVAAVRTLDHIGVPALIEMAQRLGISSFDEQSGRFGLALTLGSGEVTLLELTAAYAAFANGGYRVHPQAILDVTSVAADSDGQIRAVMQTPPTSREPVLNPQVAYLISDMLSDRYARMRAFGVTSMLDVDRPAAAKTGTTTDWRDNWTIGYSPDRVVGVWVGNADGQPMEGVSGITGAGPVWHDVMQDVHRGISARPFARPDDIIELPVCATSGLLPTPDCPATRLERFIAGTQPTRPDDTHVALTIDPERNCRVPNDTSTARAVTRVFRIFPTEAEPWAMDAGFPPVPTELCPGAVADDLQAEGDAMHHHVALAQPPRLIAPAPDSIFALSAGIPGEHQQIPLEAHVGASITQLSILVDGELVATFTAPPYRAFWPAERGIHQAEVVVEDRQGNQQQSAPVEFVVLDSAS